MNTNEMMAAMDAIIRRRSEDSLPLSELTSLVVKMFSAFRGRHGDYLVSSRDMLRELDDYLASPGREGFKSRNPEFARYITFNGSCTRECGSEKAIELSLGVNNALLTQRTRLALVFQHPGLTFSRYTDNDFNLPEYCGEPRAEVFAKELLKHGFGTEEAVAAIGEMLEVNMRQLDTHMTRFQRLLSAKASKCGCSLVKGKVACNLDAVEAAQMRQIRGDAQIETLCMETVDALREKLDYISETLAVLHKARETFYNFDDEIITRHSGANTLFAAKWLGGHMSLSISVPQAKAGWVVTFTARSINPDDNTEWYADMNTFSWVLKDFLSCPRLDGHQKDSIPSMLEEAMEELLDTCTHIRNRIKEKIKESI